MSAADSPIFSPLRFRTLEVPNRVFRSSVAGRFDNYDGSMAEVRMDWDVKFARAGIGTIISSNTPVHPRGIIVPGYAHLDKDEGVPAWRARTGPRRAAPLGRRRLRDAGPGRAEPVAHDRGARRPFLRPDPRPAPEVTHR